MSSNLLEQPGVPRRWQLERQYRAFAGPQPNGTSNRSPRFELEVFALHSTSVSESDQCRHPALETSENRWTRRAPRARSHDRIPSDFRIAPKGYPSLGSMLGVEDVDGIELLRRADRTRQACLRRRRCGRVGRMYRAHFSWQLALQHCLSAELHALESRRGRQKRDGA